MGYIALWVFSLAAALLWIATAAALAARGRRRWVGIVEYFVAASVPVGIGAVESALVLSRLVASHLSWQIYEISWLAAVFVGALAIERVGVSVKRGRTAARWPFKRIALGFCAAFALYGFTLWAMDTAVCMKLVALRAESSSMMLVAAPARPPGSQNAAYVYESAFKKLKLLKKPASEQRRIALALDKNEKFDSHDAAMIEYLKQAQPVIAELKKAAALQGCYFEKDYFRADLFAIELDELSRFRESARLLALDARMHAAHGETREALEDLATLDDLAAHAGAEPFLISGLVAVAIKAIEPSTLEEILSNSSVIPDLRAAPSKIDFRRMLTRHLIAEEALALSSISLASNADGEKSFNRLLGFSIDSRDHYYEESPAWYFRSLVMLWRVYLSEDDIADYRHYMKGLRQASAGDFQSALATAKEQDAQLFTGPTGFLTRMILPIFGRAISSYAIAEARQRLCTVAVAASAFRAKNKHLPAKLEELVPEYLTELPLDPFNGKALRYKLTNEGALIYSIGPNLIDDGGKRAEDSSRDGDVVFELKNAN